MASAASVSDLAVLLVDACKGILPQTKRHVDRVENIRRAAHAARLIVDAGLIVLTAFIFPFKAERGTAREPFHEGDFIEVYIDTPLDVCEKRDPKELYKRRAVA